MKIDRLIDALVTDTESSKDSILVSNGFMIPRYSDSRNEPKTGKRKMIVSYNSKITVIDIHGRRGSLSFGLSLAEFFSENGVQGESWKINTEPSGEDTVNLVITLKLIECLELTKDTSDGDANFHKTIYFRKNRYLISEQVTSAIGISTDEDLKEKPKIEERKDRIGQSVIYAQLSHDI